MQLHLNSVYYTYPNSITPAVTGVAAVLTQGWSCVVGPNGAGKSTLLMLVAGLITPTQGSVEGPDARIYCPQRTDEPTAEYEAFLAAYDSEAFRLRGLFAIEDDWCVRWDTLSHGERKRLQIATAIHADPDLRALDEPANHIDRNAREMLIEGLRRYNGIGVLVGHDRDMLDILCERCLFLDESGGVLRPGGYTDAAEQAALERESLRREREVARAEYKKLKRELHRRSAEAARADARRSKRGLARKDSDSRQKIDMARITGRDGVAGRLKSQLTRRLERTQERLESRTVADDSPTGITLESGAHEGRFVLVMESGSLKLSAGRMLSWPLLTVGPRDRIGVVGANGTGKSTMIRRCVDTYTGPQRSLLYIPQEITADKSRGILARVKTFNGERLGALMTIVSRLGSNPERLLESATPSPGELRKLLLALGMADAPELIIMDEPTNHLDLVSIEHVEAALSEVRCALVLVSHDIRFLDAVAGRYWRFKPTDDGVTVQIG